MKLRFLLCLSSLLMLVSCSSGNRMGEDGQIGLPLVDLVEGLGQKSQDLLLSDAASSVELIPLEANDSCMISSVDAVYVLDDDIIIQDSNLRLLHFNRQGNFLNTIGKRGQGPGEYTFIHNSFMDFDNKQVYALTSSSGAYVYDFNGNLLKIHDNFHQEEFFPLSIKALFLFDSKLFARQSGQFYGEVVTRKEQLWSLATIDSDFQLEKLYFNPAHIGHEDEILSLGIAGWANNWQEHAPSVLLYGQDLYLKHADVDTIYQYDKSQEVFMPLYSLNLGKYKGNDYMGQNMFYKERRVFDNLYIPSVYFAGGNMYLVGNMGENVYEFQYNRSNGALLVNKRPQPIEIPPQNFPSLFIRMSRDFILRNDITGGQFMVNHTTEDSWIFEVSMETIEKGLLDDLKSGTVLDEKGHERLEELVSSMDDDHNPVLVIAKLK